MLTLGLDSDILDLLTFLKYQKGRGIRVILSIYQSKSLVHICLAYVLIFIEGDEKKEYEFCLDPFDSILSEC